MRDREFVRFDPKNPETFNILYSQHREKLTEKELAQYEEDLKLFHAYQKDEQRKRETAQRNWEETGRYLKQEQEENRLVLELGDALKEAGFTVRFNATTARWRDKSETWTIHRSWARSATVFKDGQEVGYFKAWIPKDSWSWRMPCGYEMDTLRGKGNAGRYSATKRLKKLDKAVAYFVDTAVPQRAIEEDLKAAERIADSLRSKKNRLMIALKDVENGMSRDEYGNTRVDGCMRDLVTAWRDNDQAKINMILSQKQQHMVKVEREIDSIEKQLADAERVYENLHKRAAEELPEVYS